MAFQRYADRCRHQRALLDEALQNVVAACSAEPSVCQAYVFGSYVTEKIGPTSDLDVLVVRDTDLGIIDRAVDLKRAARSRVNVDLVVVTPYEFANTFPVSSFGRTVLAMAKRIYAA